MRARGIEEHLAKQVISDRDVFKGTIEVAVVSQIYLMEPYSTLLCNPSKVEECCMHIGEMFKVGI